MSGDQPTEGVTEGIQRDELEAFLNSQYHEKNYGCGAEIASLKSQLAAAERRIELAEAVCHESHIFLTDFLTKRACVPGALQRKIEAWRKEPPATEEGKT